MPSMDFSSLRKYRYKRGHFFLGVSPFKRRPVGIDSDRHAITIAGSRAGKGAGLMIPNLRRWPHNALVIDPKGEAAEHSALHRERMGQKVYVIDPMGTANVPDRMRARLNPLDRLRLGTRREYTDILAVADGLVMRSDPTAAFFDGGGIDILAGAIVDVLCDPDPANRNLVEARRRIRNDFDALVERCIDNPAMSGLAEAMGGRMMFSGDGPAKSFKATADENSKWLDDSAMTETLSASDFDFDALKTEPMTIYLVIDPDLLELHGRFLRLFVRTAISVMAQKDGDGQLKGRRCLFFLDEFFSLGFMNEIQKSAGAMPGYGLHLWPILQDIEQLTDLYGRSGAATFFGNSDAHTFFGNTDNPTLDYISDTIGRRYEAGFFGGDKEHVGHPFMTPQEVRQHVRKPNADALARRMIVFGRGSDVLSIRPKPYFRQSIFRRILSIFD